MGGKILVVWDAPDTGCETRMPLERCWPAGRTSAGFSCEKKFMAGMTGVQGKEPIDTGGVQRSSVQIVEQNNC